MASGLRRLLVVLAVAGAGFVPVPATAAGYCSASGVSVVVDFGALGGGIQKGCDSSGNRNAAKAFVSTGHPLTYAQRQPGFVCRVDGAPQSDPCVNTSPADAYWGLYWSDGKSGWKYSSVAVGSLTVPAGGTVAFSWQNGGDADPPGTAPAPIPPPPVSSPRPTRTPTPTTVRPSATAQSPAASRPAGSATPSATGSASATSASTSASSSPSASATTTPSASASPSSEVASGSAEARLDPSAESDGGLPWWLPVGLILALAILGGVVVRVRRTRS